jgi:endonuclease/exonuclease/phosphatase family metal-dependent hydrolase
MIQTGFITRWLRAVAAWVVVVAAQAESLTLATYNLENYTLADRMTPSGFRPDYPKPEAAKIALRAVLHRLDADLLVLQEIGGKPFLAELVRDLAGEGLVYPHAEILEASDEPRHVAVLSRRPFTRVRPHADLRFTYLGAAEQVKRGVLEVTVTFAERELSVFALHLKSRTTERKEDPQSALRRASEAEALRDRVLALYPDPTTSRFVVAGDFNDGPSSRAVRALQQRGSKTIATLVPATDEQGETWTHRYRAEDSYTRVDHLLISPGLLAAVETPMARILSGADVNAASDHRPLVLTLGLAGAP